MLLRRNVWAHSLIKDRLDNYTRLKRKKMKVMFTLCTSGVIPSLRSGF